MTKYQFSKIKNVHYNFFSAERGFSSFPYNSLNCSFNTQDSYENIIENRKYVKDIINLNDLFFINQIHSNKVFFLENKKQLSSKLDVDGVVTNLKNVGLSILTADCAPIFFLDLNNDIIAACHAGWRGALNGIIENTINKMIEIGSLRKNILAIIGPTIQQHSYEIGNDLAIKIECTAEYKSKNNILLEKSKKYFFNLPLFIKHKLNLNEINNISDVEIDTYLNKNFFSYRRTTQNRKSDSLKKATGRQVSVIGLK